MRSRRPALLSHMLSVHHLFQSFSLVIDTSSRATLE